ncbi:hypothetical protein RRG08_049455 [Elysia crispata]|uniref:Uncharacterized protein n=1 Tax=Elysia crispata TaxID=231223 RepID=A0AAE0ZS09_9GAST|nr:hypothetical protein RRG08_049455 [Elysia crispata]
MVVKGKEIRIRKKNILVEGTIHSNRRSLAVPQLPSLAPNPRILAAPAGRHFKTALLEQQARRQHRPPFYRQPTVSNAGYVSPRPGGPAYLSDGCVKRWPLRPE